MVLAQPSSTPSTDRWLLLNQQADEELANRLLAGEHDALAVLFDRYQRLVYSVAMRIVQDSGEAEEVVQTVFLDFYRAVANFDSRKGMLKVWLLQYAYHRALQRKRHLVANRFYKWVDLESSASEPSLSWSPTQSFEVAQLMDQMLGRLSARRRLVVELTYVEGLTAEEIAMKLEISVNVVRHELYRGLASLRQALSKQARSSGEELKSTVKEARRASTPAI